MSRTDLYANTLMRVYGPEGGTLKFLPVSPSGYGRFQPSRRSAPSSFGYTENADGSITYLDKSDGTWKTAANIDEYNAILAGRSSGTTKSKLSGEQIAGTVQSVADAITGLVGAFKKPQQTYVPQPTTTSTVPWGWIIGGVLGVAVLGVGAYVLTRPVAPAGAAT